jgi:hypothetical protein
MARPILRRAVLATLAAAAFSAAPTTAGEVGYDPPSWFTDGVAKVKARAGAECPGPEPFTRTYTIPIYDGVPPEPSPRTRREDGTTEDCLHRLPRALAKRFLLLRQQHGQEGCHGEDRHDAPVDSPGVVQDQTSFRCDVFYRPVIRGHPNRRSWQCWRSAYFRHAYEADGGETVRGGKPYWFTEETKYWRDQRFKSLSRCLNPKYRKPK